MIDYYKKYIKYKHKYLRNKSLSLNGGSKLTYYNLGEKKYTFHLKSYISIKEATDILFMQSETLVITRLGIVYHLTEDNEQSVILDLKSNPDFIHNNTELGLLGIARINNKIYLSYTIGTDTTTQLVLAEYDTDPEFTKLNKQREILKIDFPTDYHHGGHLVTVGKFIYLGVGDGGPQGDPDNQGQDLSTLRGKLMKIDPETNRLSILAIGLRNPWMFSVDNMNRVWIGDVGWNTSETVKLIEDPDRMYNFGWSVFEGSHRVKSTTAKASDFDMPIFEYPTSNSTGRCIIGGFYINLGIYVFADYLGIIRAIQKINDKWVEVANDKLLSDEKIYATASDNKIIYILTDKNIYSLVIDKL